MENSKQDYLRQWIDSKIVTEVPDFIPLELLSDKDFVLNLLETIDLRFPLLKFVGDNLLTDADVLSSAVLHNTDNHKYIPQEMFKDDKVMSAAIEADGGFRHSSLDDMLDEIEFGKRKR